MPASARHLVDRLAHPVATAAADSGDCRLCPAAALPRMLTAAWVSAVAARPLALCAGQSSQREATPARYDRLRAVVGTWNHSVPARANA